jgi:starvation-inducible DNA-binding protein
MGALMMDTGISAKDRTAIAGGLSRMFVGQANDQPTLDLLTQRLDIHEKNAWVLRSLLKK